MKLGRLISKKDAFEIEYVVKHRVRVGVPKTSLAKTFKETNEMEVVLEVPKSMYQDEGVQKLLTWSEGSKNDKEYYRDLSVSIEGMQGYQRTIVFTHAEILIHELGNTTADYVTITVFVKQKRDKAVGVVFGEEFEATFAKAMDKVANPPSLNIFIPPVGSANKDDKQYVDEKDTDYFTKFKDRVIKLYTEPTLAEKLLVVAYPLQALIVKNNSKKAQDAAREQFKEDGELSSAAGRADAFRHSYWNALNTRDINPTYVVPTAGMFSSFAPPTILKIDFAKEFATAHEEENDEYKAKLFYGFTGQQHITMDLHNNHVGRSLTYYNENVSDLILQERCLEKLTDGYLYLLTTSTGDYSAK
jgi:hypothetical protein